jgi:hypothetical protein
MNVPRRLIGKVVSIQWCDPNNARGPIETLKRGRAALATWTEFGTLHDVTDGVVLIVHSYATEPGGERPDECQRTAIHEALIEKVTVYAELPTEGS